MALAFAGKAKCPVPVMIFVSLKSQRNKNNNSVADRIKGNKRRVLPSSMRKVFKDRNVEKLRTAEFQLFSNSRLEPPGVMY